MTKIKMNALNKNFADSTNEKNSTYEKSKTNPK